MGLRRIALGAALLTVFASAAPVAAQLTGQIPAPSALPIASAETRSQVPLSIAEIAPGVFVHLGQMQVWRPGTEGDIANLGFVVGGRCVAVIDTGSSLAIGQRLLATVRAKTDKPVCFVITTHAHPDHSLGNAAFIGEKPEFVGHTKLAQALAQRGPGYVNAALRDLGVPAQGTKLVAPTVAVAVTEPTHIDLGNRRLELRAWPTAHTDADLTVFDETSETIFLGDLAFVGHLPVVDGNLKGWLAALDRLAAMPARRAVPGHGAVADGAWPSLLEGQRRYLSALQQDIRRAIRDGLTLSQTIETVTTGRSTGWSLYEDFHKRNVSAAYAELEWE